MKRLLAMLVSFMLTLSLGCHVSSPIQRARASIVRITGSKAHIVHPFEIEVEGDYVCTGFVVRKPNIVLTANHCIGNGMLADGLKVTKVFKQDRYYDLALVEVKDLDKPALRIRSYGSYLGESLTAVGYGEGWDKPLVMQERTTVPLHIPDDTKPDESAAGVIVNGNYVGGMSGGPVVDDNGIVVTMAQQVVNYGLGYGVDGIMMHAFLHDVGAE